MVVVESGNCLFIVHIHTVDVFVVTVDNVDIVVVIDISAVDVVVVVDISTSDDVHVVDIVAVHVVVVDDVDIVVVVEIDIVAEIYVVEIYVVVVAKTEVVVETVRYIGVLVFVYFCIVCVGVAVEGGVCG